MIAQLWARRWVRNTLLLALVLAAAGSTVQGMRDAWERSQDFQWSGAHMLVHHIDPWRDYLLGDPAHQIYGTQIPNYLALLYVLMWPLGLLSRVPATVAWSICNLCFALMSGMLGARFFGLRGPKAVVAVCLLMVATPVRTSIGNGQTGLLVLWMWTLAFLTRQTTPGSALAAGVSYVKFTFAPPAFLLLLLRERRWYALLSLVPAAAGLLCAFAWLHREPGHVGLVALALEPFKVAAIGYYPRIGSQNLMDVLQIALNSLHLSDQTGDMITLLVSTVVCFCILFAATRGPRRHQRHWHAALVGLMGFALFRHHTYDGVTLFLPLCYALQHWRRAAAQVALALLAWVLYLRRVLDALHQAHNANIYVFDTFVLLAALALIFRIGSVEPAENAAAA